MAPPNKVQYMSSSKSSLGLINSCPQPMNPVTIVGIINDAHLFLGSTVNINCDSVIDISCPKVEYIAANRHRDK